MKKITIVLFLLFVLISFSEQSTIQASPTPTTSITPTVWVSNLDSSLDVRINTQQYSRHFHPDERIEVGDLTGSNDSNQFVSVLNSFESIILSKFYANFSSGSNLNWSRLVNDFDKSRGAIYFNSTDDLGLSSVSGLNDIPDVYLKQSSTFNISRLTEYSTNETILGNPISIDDDNNVAMVVTRDIISWPTRQSEAWLYIWNDPINLSRGTVDHIVNIGNQFPLPDYNNKDASVESLGDGNFLIVWINEEIATGTKRLFYKIIDSDGQIVLDDVDLVDSRFVTEPALPKISKINNGQVMVVWQDDYNGGDLTRSVSGIGQIIDSTGNMIGDYFFISPKEHSVDETDVDRLSDGRFVIVWYDGNNEDLYYRIFDPSTMSFSIDSTFIDDYSATDYAGYTQSVAGDDQGGFGVIWGGYFDDGVDYFDRVYFQMFDSLGNPTYLTTDDILISDDSDTSWYWDLPGVEYYNNEFQMVWDTYPPGLSTVIGVAYKKINIDGTKSDTVMIERTIDFASVYSACINLNKDGVPLISWIQSHWYTKELNYGIFGTYGPMPNETPNRFGFCPNALSLTDVNKSCIGLQYMTSGDPGVSMSSDDLDYKMAHVSYVLSGFDKGGAFVDGASAFAFKDFGQEQTTYDNLEVKWYDTGLSGDGEINFYYDTDNSGFDGTAISGTYLESGAANTAILDLSSVPSGDYYLYAVVDDGYYLPFYEYSPFQFSKIDLITPTPTVTVTDTPTITPTDTPITTPTETPTETPIESPTTSLEENIPQKVKITDIGLIKNVVEKDFVGYYFTSQTPVIKGMAERLNTVHFVYNGKDYTTTADEDGKFSLKINNPILPRTVVDLVYYSSNLSGADSSSRVLRLVIGIENFPTWLIEKMNAGGTTEDVVVATISDSPNVLPTTKSPISETKSTSVEVLLKDLEGKILMDSDIKFDGKALRTDSDGKIKFESLDLGTHVIEYNGEVKSISVVKGDNSFVIYYSQSALESDIEGLSPIYYVLIGIGVIATIIIGFKILKKR